MIVMPSVSYVGGSGLVGDGTLYGIIQGLGLTSNLQLCLDAGDASSYTSGQSWLDRSGGGYDYFLGDTSASEGTDPTFNGSAGGKSASEYFSNDGGDYFTYDSAVETWMSSIHKNNATFTMVAVFWPPVSSSERGIWRGSASVADIGANLAVSATDKLALSVLGSGGSPALTIASTASVTENAWNFLAVALNEATGANGATLQVNSTQESFTSTYASPSASAATQKLLMFNHVSGMRLACLAVWTTRLTDQNLTDIKTNLAAARAYGF